MTNPPEPNDQPQQQPGGGYEPPPTSDYVPPTAAGYDAPPAGQFPPPGTPYPPMPPAPPGYAYADPAPSGMYIDPASGLTLPQGTELASVGRRIGAYFLSIVLALVTLVIGYLIWGLIAWRKGTSPAFQVLGIRVWQPRQNRPATFGTMALRNIVGGIATGILGIVTELISFIMFLAGGQHQSLADKIASTVVVHDPNKIIP